MARIDIEELLAAVSEDQPCGENLEYDVEFGELERSAQGKAEQAMGDSVVPAEPPNWKTIDGLTCQLAGRSKDLRVLSQLIRAQLGLHGLEGLNDGLALLHGTLERYWDSVHPQLDSDDDNDPTLRVNIIMGLSDGETLLQELRLAPVVTSRALGTFSYRDIAVASGEIGSGEENGKQTDQATIAAAFRDASLTDLEVSAAAARGALDHARGIEAFVTEQVGASNGPNLGPIVDVLRSIDRILAEQVGLLGGTGEAAETESDEESDMQGGGAEAQGTTGAPRAGGGQVNSREDVVKAIDRICAYYARNEPSSPVPLLLQRAKRLVAKDFMEILRDMVPSGVSEAEQIGGTESSES